MIRVFSGGIYRIPGREVLLGDDVMMHRPWRPTRGETVAGWGLKPSGLAARRYAEARGLPFLALEDGFLRSVELGGIDPPLSLLWDDIGIYYDASRPSRLEQGIAQPLEPEQHQRTIQLIRHWREGRVSKYNHLREYAGELPERYVLVVDQTRGDASIAHGMASQESFTQMLEAALVDNPDCSVVLKTHPDVFAGKKEGNLDLKALAADPRIQILAEDVHPVRLIEHATALYVVTSQMGFEGLLWGKPVHTFGMPFYAGWGLTQDQLPAPTRRQPASLEQLVHAVLIDYPRYISPETWDRCEVEEVLAHIALQREMRARFPAQIFALGFSLYKRGIVRRFFQGSEVSFVRHVAQVPAGGTLAVWGAGAVAGMQGRRDIHLIRLEDGFLRSVGLGADLIQPLSWVMDSRGLYFDARRPSDLEHILTTVEFSTELVKRAGALQQQLNHHGLTKYNVGEVAWERPQHLDATVILVPGQVESDASLAYGAAQFSCNMALLREVREANPDAYVIYKPHPDVVAGLRKAGEHEKEAANWCDTILIDAPMGELLQQVDEVHTHTSLAGFEALLRGKRVVCYGQPFYCGWGLTTDMRPLERRGRTLTIGELVAGVLLLYPVYLSRRSNRFTTPEQALCELLEWRNSSGLALPWWRHILRQVLKIRRN